jgi:hypothetical protein
MSGLSLLFNETRELFSDVTMLASYKINNDATLSCLITLHQYSKLARILGVGIGGFF